MRWPWWFKRGRAPLVFPVYFYQYGGNNGCYVVLPQPTPQPAYRSWRLKDVVWDEAAA